LNGADAASGQPTDTLKCTDAIACAELMCEMFHHHHSLA
jgi:hypothetical protein